MNLPDPARKPRKAAKESAAKPLSTKEEMEELPRIVQRLERIVVRHLESAQAMGIDLGEAEVLRVIDALDAQADGRAPGKLHDDEVKRYAMESLYEELLDEPANTPLATKVDDLTTRYDAMQPAFWKRCLAGLKLRCHDA